MRRPRGNDQYGFIDQGELDMGDIEHGACMNPRDGIVGQSPCCIFEAQYPLNVTSHSVRSLARPSLL